MKKLQVGDQFHRSGYDHDIYTVLEVHKYYYVVKQKSYISGDSHSVETIHCLFTGNNPWILKRKKINHFDEGLFNV